MPLFTSVQTGAWNLSIFPRPVRRRLSDRVVAATKRPDPERKRSPC